MRGFERIIGQEQLVSSLRRLGDVCVATGNTIEHLLLVGPEGMGKQTIATAAAEQYGLLLAKCRGEEIKINGDLTATVTNIQEHQVLFIDNVHVLPRSVTNLLRQAIEHYKLEICIGTGSSARVHTIDVKSFTFIGTVPQESALDSGMLAALPLRFALAPYSLDELRELCLRFAHEFGLRFDSDVVDALVRASGRTPGALHKSVQRLARYGSTDLITLHNPILQALLPSVIKTTTPFGPVNTDLDSLSGTDFERLIISLLEHMGLRAEGTKASGDGGIDVVAVLDTPVIGGKVLVQCKRYAPDSSVGAPTVREFYGALRSDSRATKGVLITTSTFTAQAIEFAEANGVELIDRVKLQKLLAEHFPQQYKATVSGLF